MGNRTDVKVKGNTVLILAAAVAGCMLAACAGSPVRLSMMDAKELKKQSDVAICNAYHSGHYKNVKAEIDRRKLVPADEWSNVEKGKIHVGMPAIDLVCAWGLPNLYGHIHTLSTSHGTSYQWVYRACGDPSACPAHYAYTAHGVITAIQQ